MSRPAGYPVNGFLRETPRQVRVREESNAQVGSLHKGNKRSSYLGRGVVCAADIPPAWHGGHYGKPRHESKVASKVSVRDNSAQRPPAQGREATLYAWEVLIASYGQREASQRFRQVASARGRSGDKLAAQHRLAGYVAAA